MAQPSPGGPSDRPRGPTPPTALSNCRLVLCRTQGPVNLGMVARLCGNLGIPELALVAPECGIDIPEARMFSTHSKELLLSAPVYATLEEATADCGYVVGTSGDFRVGELGAPIPAQRLPALLAERPCTRWALVFGCESDGLNEQELRACQAWIHLDTWGHNISFNLANAVAICGYLIAMHSAAGRPPEPDSAPEPMASRREVEGLEEFWSRTLERFHYFRRTDRERFRPQFRKLLGRLHLTSHDIGVIRGMLAQMHWFAFGDRGTGDRSPDDR